MSPLWRDDIRIQLSPLRVALMRMNRGVRPRCIGEFDGRVMNDNLMDWRPALAVMQSQITDAAWEGTNVRVVISDHWVRYAIVPWSNHIVTDEERLAYAASCLANVYGSVADQWRVRVSEGAPGQARITCAIREALLGEIRTTLDICRLSLVSMQPQLIAAYNTWRDRLPNANGWFVTIEEGSLAAARLVGGGWDRVYSARIGGDWMVELQRLKTFGRLAAQDGKNGRVYVDAPLWLRKLAGDCGPGVEWLVDERVESTAGDNLTVLRRMYS